MAVEEVYVICACNDRFAIAYGKTASYTFPLVKCCPVMRMHVEYLFICHRIFNNSVLVNNIIHPYSSDNIH